VHTYENRNAPVKLVGSAATRFTLHRSTTPQRHDAPLAEDADPAYASWLETLDDRAAAQPDSGGMAAAVMEAIGASPAFRAWVQDPAGAEVAPAEPEAPVHPKEPEGASTGLSDRMEDLQEPEEPTPVAIQIEIGHPAGPAAPLSDLVVRSRGPNAPAEGAPKATPPPAYGHYVDAAECGPTRPTKRVRRVESVEF
jgi:hypothetical protein